MNELVIYKNRIKHNINIIKNKNENIIWVLKDNAYGIGLKEIYQILHSLNENDIAVSTYEECHKIRKIENKQNLKPSNIYILNRLENKDILKAYHHNIYITIINNQQLDAYITKLKKNNLDISNLKVNIKLDTGMNRLGFSNKYEIEKLINTIKKYSIKVISIFTHIGNYENIEEQNDKYLEHCSIFDRENIGGYHKHIQASPTLFKDEKYKYDYARIGMALYGLNPLPNLLDNPLKIVFDLKAKIIDIKTIKKGNTFSYSQIKVDKDMTIAIISIGYAHGIYKSYNGYVLINGKYCKILDICMDMTIVDITDKDISINDDVFIINLSITPEIIAQNTNTIADDIISKISKDNIKRIIKETT